MSIPGGNRTESLKLVLIENISGCASIFKERSVPIKGILPLPAAKACLQFRYYRLTTDSTAAIAYAGTFSSTRMTYVPGERCLFSA